MRHFDAIVIGAGQAGPPLAGRLSAAGKTVAVIERHLVGGTCVNTGCKPTKTLVASAYAAHLARRGADYGVLTGPIAIDMATVHARTRKISTDSRTSNETWLAGLDGCELIFGQARFEGPKTVRVGEELLTADHIFLNVGGRALIPDMPGAHDVPLLTNSSLLDLATMPEHLVVIGGSYIGLEFGQAYRRLGARVTIVEKGPRLVGREDERVSDAMRALLEAEGIAIRTDAECIRFAPHADGIAVGLFCGEGEPEVIASHVLMAVGRIPNTADLGLDVAGIATDDRGYISVDDRLETTVPGVWALGDCNGRGAFTHTSYNDFEIVAENLLDGRRPQAWRSHPLLCAVHRSAARPRRAERRPGRRRRAPRQDRAPPDEPRRPRGREGRTSGLHGDRRRCGERSHPGRHDPGDGRRRGDPFDPRHDGERRHCGPAPPHRPHPPDGVRTAPDDRGRGEVRRAIDVRHARAEGRR